MNLELLKELGLSEQDIIDRALDKICEEFFEKIDSHYFDGEEKIIRIINEKIESHINKKVAEMGDQYILPKVTDIIENLTLQETNKWGEKTKSPLTFIEYLVKKAEEYMQEPVNNNGKSKQEEPYSWSNKTTRICYITHKHLQADIEAAMKKAIAEANSSIAKGLEGAVKIALEQATSALRVSITA